MSEGEERSPGMLSVGDWAEKARQMHDDLMGLMCAGVITEKTRPSRPWMAKSYQTLVGRLKQLVSGSPLDHLAETPETLIEMCLALGQVQVTFNAVRLYLEAANQPPFGFQASVSAKDKLEIKRKTRSKENGRETVG